MRQRMIQNNITAITIVLGAITVILVALVAFLYWRMRRLEGDYELLSRGTQGKNFVEIVNENISHTERLMEEVDSLSERYAFVLRRMAGAVQHVGVVRYDAFRDLGGLLSYSIALLDDRGNGMALSSIYGRSESRTYSKPIVERGSTYELSPEEKEAIRLAMQSKELGALPVEARDREHEEKIATLKLFHEKEYQEMLRPEPEPRPAPRRPPQPQREPAREMAAEAPREKAPRDREQPPARKAPADVRVRQRPQREHPRQEATKGAHDRELERLAEKRERERRMRPEEKPARQERGPVEERPVGVGEDRQERPSPAVEKAEPERPAGGSRLLDAEAELPPPQSAPRKEERRPAPRPRGLDSPVDRLRNREPGGE